VTESNELTPANLAVFAAEILPGLWLAWRLVLRPAARAQPASAHLPAWKIPASEFILFLCFALFGGLAGSALAGLLHGLRLRAWQPGENETLVLGSLAMHLGILGGMAAYFGVYAPRGTRRRPAVLESLRTGLATFLLTLPAVMAASVLSSLLLRALGVVEKEQDALQIYEGTHGFLRVVFIATATGVVPITEEFFFRAGLFRFLRSRTWRPLALLLPAVIFGALHVSSPSLAGLTTFLPLTVLALVFSLAYERTGNIGTTIVAHCLFNLNTFVLMATGIAT
jgi:membrane protease YdiL (CAAX protease family)